MNEQKNIVDLFKKDLWKDQRRLEVKNGNINEGTLIKYYDNLEEKETEISILKFLKKKKIEGIPEIHSHEYLSTIMPYYGGIRLFNLFVELDSLTERYNDNVSKIKRELIMQCEKRQRCIQKAMLEWREKQGAREAYPHAKIKSIVNILASCLGIEIKEAIIEKEIENINEYWNSVVSVPFRDATTKNMILNSPELRMDNFSSDEERSIYIYQSIHDGSYNRWLEAPIVDIDFSSCIHDTTFEDDVISLKYHERTWSGIFPESGELLWHGTPDAKRAAITFLIRYFRFGGRKAAYRLINPQAHRIRFKYDNDLFYFERLPEIMRKLWPQCMEEYPNLISFIETASRYLVTTSVTTDLFLEYYNESGTYYTDVYPN